MKASFYKYADPVGEEKLLFFIANTTPDNIERLEIHMLQNYTKAVHLPDKKEVEIIEGNFNVSLGAFGYSIFYII